jgi:hypothetical protein
MSSLHLDVWECISFSLNAEIGSCIVCPVDENPFLSLNDYADDWLEKL